MRPTCRLIFTRPIWYIVMVPGSGRLAQLGERCVRNAEVGGSIPPSSTKSPPDRLQMPRRLRPQCPFTLDCITCHFRGGTCFSLSPGVSPAFASFVRLPGQAEACPTKGHEEQG